MDNNKLPIYILIGVAVVVLIGVVGVLVGRKTPEPAAVTLEFWSIQDDESVWRDVLDAYKKIAPNITINYRRIDEASYEDTLVNALAEGKGPDIFVLPSSLINKHRDKIYPLPQEYFQFTPQNFQNTFVDGVYPNLVTSDGSILGLPLFMDTLGLYYNKDIFNAAGIAQPPKTWNDILTLTPQLTKVTPAGDVTKYGIALGTARNVDHVFELLTTLMLQNGDPIYDLQSKQLSLQKPAQDALQFYTSFANPAAKNFSWTNHLGTSLSAFAGENSAMVLGFSSDRKVIQVQNPHINLAVAPFPQTANTQHPVVYASYFFPTVSKQSQNPGTAWQFVLFITSHDGARLYLNAAQRPAARRDLIAAGSPTADLSVFYRQSLIGRTLPGIDERAAGRVFGDAIDSVVSGIATPDQAMNKLREQVRLLVP